MKTSQRIALVLPQRAAFGLRILQGVSTYARPVKPWVLHTISMGPEAFGALEKWEPTGVIAFLGTPQMHQSFAKSNWPLVNVSNSVKKTKLPTVISDDKTVGELAATHLIESGFKSFAFCGKKNAAYALARCDGFKQTLQKNSFDCQEYEKDFDAQAADVFGDWSSTKIDEQLGQWLKDLPKPVGVFACQDYIAFILSEICRQFDIRVPEDVALIGVDDDQMVCESARPSLTSIRASMEQIGYEAASMLDKMLEGKIAQDSSIVIAPKGVVARQSTDVTLTKDPDLSRALRFIRENADKPINVDDVLDEVLISRRSLENKMKTLLGRTPLDEIHRVHLERAKRLLIETNIPIERIAISAGFTSPTRMEAAFRKHIGHTPRQHRKQNRMGDS